MSAARAGSPDAHSDAARFVIAHNNVFHLGWWREAPDGDTVARWRDAQLTWAQSTSGPRFSLAVADHIRAVMPDARTGFARAADDMAPLHIQGGILILGGGFVGSIVRSAITAVGMLSRNALPLLVAGSVDEMFTKLPADVQRRVAYDEIIAAGGKRA